MYGVDAVSLTDWNGLNVNCLSPMASKFQILMTRSDPNEMRRRLCAVTGCDAELTSYDGVRFKTRPM